MGWGGATARVAPTEVDIAGFTIIAHIDHGKSTLADRLLEKCNAVPEREMETSCWTTWTWNAERGITIKSRAVRCFYTARDGETYALNLIDTPGHVDFNYEVSRSLAACEGALLVVDATQGVEAQTLANTYLAMDHDLEILPVFNKIDLPAADPLRAKQEVEDIIGLPAMDAPEISAKIGHQHRGRAGGRGPNVPAPSGDPKPCRRWCSTASTTPTWAWWCISASCRALCGGGRPSA